MTRVVEFTRFPVNPEYDDIVAFLTFHQCERSRWINVEVSRNFDCAARKLSDRFQPAICLVNPEPGDRIVSPIRAVNELS